MTANHHRLLFDSDIALIERVKMIPSLYNTRHPEFRSAFRKEQDWETIAAFLGRTATEVRRRWTCLRDRYSRELRQVRLHPEREEFGNNTFFIQMDFLRSFVRKRRQRSSGHSFKSSINNENLNKIVKASESDEDVGYEEVTEEDQDPLTAEQFMDIHEYTNAHSTENFDELEHTSNEIINDLTDNTENDEKLTFEKELHEPSVAKRLRLEPDIHNNSLDSYIEEEQNLPQLHSIRQIPQRQPQKLLAESTNGTETEDEYFCRSLAPYLRQFSVRNKIKAKVEILQILEKFLDVEEKGA